MASVRRGMLSSPLHILIYGRQNHREDGFSIVNQDNTHTSHVHVSDAESIEEVRLDMKESAQINLKRCLSLG